MNPKKFIKCLAQFCRCAFLLVFFLLLTWSKAFAAPGDLDPAFGSGDTVLTEFDRRASGRIVLLQPDNKIIVAGSIVNSTSPPDQDYLLVRYNPDGSLDPAFGSQGKVITSVLANDAVLAAALQPDGKIVAGAYSGNQFSLVRYNPNGSLDSGFGNGGKVLASISPNDFMRMNTLLIQPDGKILAAGDDDNFNIYLVRFTPDGTLDSSFGSGGKVATRFSVGGNTGKSAALQSDGKILVGGSVYNKNSARDSAIFRFNTDGTVDTSFDQDGIAVYPLSSGHDYIKKILIRPDGKILSVGSSVMPNENVVNYAIGVYNADGMPVSSFGTNGFSLLPQISITAINDAQLQPDGKIVVTGDKSNPFGSTSNRLHIARFNANGTFDYGFGNGGKVNLPIGEDSFGRSVAVQPDGKLLVGGYADTGCCNKNFVALSRFQGGNAIWPLSATITGRVRDDFYKRGIDGVQVVLSGDSSFTPRTVRTNHFGYYRFTNVPTGSAYNITVISKKRATFQSSLSDLLINGNEFVDDIIFHTTGN